VEFHGATLHAVTIDGVHHVALRPICDDLTIDFSAQRQRILRHPVLSTCVGVTTTQVAGDDQARELLCLPLDKLDGWLFGISAARVRDPAKRERLIQYQRECFDVLAQHFGIAPALAAPPAPPPKALPTPEPQPPTLRYRRWLVATDGDGRETVQPVSHEHVVMRPVDTPRWLIDWALPDEVLEAIVAECLRQMSGRLAMHRRLATAAACEKGAA
jgi:hypothetical protein